MVGLCGQREKGGREVVAALSKDMTIDQSNGVMTIRKIISNTSAVIAFLILALFMFYTSSLRTPVIFTLIMVNAKTRTKRIIAPAEDIP